jgi:Ca2+-binding EF-hand superfamily protein
MSRTEANQKILKAFDKVFDDYNGGKVIKDRMLKNCAILYNKIVWPLKNEQER